VRVLHLDTGRGWRGGQQQVYLLHRQLARAGVDSRLLARAGSPLVGRCREEGLPVAELPPGGLWSLRSLLGFHRAADGVTHLHAHDSHAAALGALAKVLRPRLRLVGHRRVSYPLGTNPGSRWKYRRVDAWIAVSGEVAETLLVAGVPRRCIRVVHSALDLEWFRHRAAQSDPGALRREFGIAPEAPVVGLVGALSPQKGHDTLLGAVPAILREFPGTRFLLAGEGELRRHLEREVGALGLAAPVCLLGFRSDIPGLTALLSVAVVPSVDGEGSSAALKEPMALGIPLVASDLPGNREVVGDAALVVPRGDAGALAGAVKRLLGDEALGADLAARGRQRVEEFRPERMADQVLAAYQALAREAL